MALTAPTHHLIPIESPYFLRVGELPAAVDWLAVFGASRPLVLEIGCGIGDFVVQLATAQPERNFIALDYYNKGCLATCRRLERHGLANVRVLRVEARQFIRDHLAPGSLAAVFINCPDPWPKQRHRKRRLVNADFVALLRDYLAPGGDLYFATDFADYGVGVARVMAAAAGFANCLAPDPYRHEMPDYPLSKYMRRFLAEGQRLYFVHYRKRSEE